MKPPDHHALRVVMQVMARKFSANCLPFVFLSDGMLDTGMPVETADPNENSNCPF